MQWLLLICLGLWTYLQGRTIRRLEDRLARIERLSAERSEAEPSRLREVVIPPSPGAPAAEATAHEPDPVILAEERVESEEAPSPPSPWGDAAPISPPPVFARAQKPRVALSTWLAENGLAWIGGGGLALGGLLIVAYAAQRGFFTPALRILTAAATGGVMIAASEWIRRQSRAPGGRHALAAALAAGAGAVTLYGAVWAAAALYQLIPLPTAALLAVLISLGLLSLSLLHGEPLALLAVFGAALAPALASPHPWPPYVQDGYLLLLTATAAAVSARRRWARANLASLLAMTVWALIDLVTGRETSAALLSAAIAVAGVAPLAWARRDGGLDGGAARFTAFPHHPMIALVAASGLALLQWFTRDQLAGAAPWVGTGLCAVLVLIAAAATVLRLAPPRAFAAPVAVAVLGPLVTAQVLQTEAATLTTFLLLAGLCAVIAACGLAASLRRGPDGRAEILIAAAVGVAALATIAWTAHRPDAEVGAATLAALGAVMFAGAWRLARVVETPQRDLGLGVCIAAGAEAAYLAIHALAPMHLAPAAHAAAALALAFAAARLGWRGLAPSAVAGGLAAIATLLRPSLLSGVLVGEPKLWLFGLVVGVAIAALLAASLIVARADPVQKGEAESLTTAALIAGLIGLFVVLRVVLGTAMGPDRDSLLEASVRVVLMLAAALLLAVRARPQDGRVARWRLLALTSLGAGYGLVTGGVVLNPWWGAGTHPFGPPVANLLLLEFLAPTLLLAAVAARRPADNWARGWAVVSAFYGLLWAILTVRHGFQGAAMATAGIGRAEVAVYAVLGLGVALVLRREVEAASRTAWLAAASPSVDWTALGFAAVIFGYFASPWWGPDTSPLPSWASGALLLGAYALGAIGAFGLRRGKGVVAEIAACVAVGVAFVLTTLTIRWAFNGADMHTPLSREGLQTWTFSALWALFGLAVLAAAQRDVTLRWCGLVVLLGTAAKVLLFDMARLDGLVRAASFLAVGALFIAGAMAMRRMNARAMQAQTETAA